jgi:hypothetical protein
MPDTIPPSSMSVHGPYEDLGIAAISLIEKIVDKQSAAVSEEIWKIILEDMKGWREFVKEVRSIGK